jgi:hypothetical protein
MAGERLAVFGYASLVSPASISVTLGRRVESCPLARLSGWRRRWSVARDNLATEKTFAPPDGGEPFPWCLGLNVERDADGGEGSAPNGALIEVSAAELERLGVREMRYDPVEVTRDVILADGTPPGIDRVFAFTAKPRHHFPVPPGGAVIMRSYLAAVEAAFDALGEGELELFRATTGPVPVEPVDGVLVRDRIPPGNPRDW